MDAIDAIRFDERGLVPVVAQDARTGEVLMLAYANREAVTRTVETSVAHYYSRSRNALWRKGETSGHEQAVAEVLVDCDEDALVYRVVPAGPACHTGERTCFFRRLDGGRPAPPADVLAALEDVIAERKRAGGARSYVRSLLDRGPAAVAAKVTEEAGEVAQALTAPEPDDALCREIADLWFHSLVALGLRSLPAARVYQVLRQRFGVSGILEKEARAPGKKDSRDPTA